MDLGIGGKVAVITGAGRGIGLATARALAAEGARVALVARDAARLEDAARELRAAGAEAVALPADLADAGAAAGLAERVEAELGPARILVCAAAAPPPYARFAALAGDAVADAVRAEVALVEGPARALLPAMVAAGWGRIVTIGSLAGELGGVGQAPYAAAKAALVGLTRTLALEHARHGVTANLVIAGGVDTARLRAAVSDDVRAGIVARTPAGRLADEREIADLVVFLASERAGFVQGAAVHATGGYELNTGW
jgi:NAD(P)-dependent dehydrogenase (short-subunit alcohol dehydrogenase family)